MRRATQMLVELQTGKPAREVVYDLYYVRRLTLQQVSDELRRQGCPVTVTTLRKWMDEWGYGRTMRPTPPPPVKEEVARE